MHRHSLVEGLNYRLSKELHSKQEVEVLSLQILLYKINIKVNIPAIMAS